MRATLVLMSMFIAVIASAAPRKVLVLPLDGNAPAAQRSKLNASVVKMAKKNLAGDVTVGDTTFAETAAAVGCDPQSAECAQTVLTTLSVDEIVYGAATKDGKSIKVVVKRVQKGSEPQVAETSIAATDSADKAEPGIEAAFSEAKPAEPPPPVEPPPAVEPPKERPRPTKGIAFFDTKERIMGVAFGAGGVIAIAVGISFWVGKSEIQGQIDDHPTNTLADFQQLEDLEDQAGEKALLGNVFVGLGIVLGGASAYMFYRDSKNREAAVSAQPTEAGTGAVITYGGRW